MVYSYFTLIDSHTFETDDFSVCFDFLRPHYFDAVSPNATSFLDVFLRATMDRGSSGQWHDTLQAASKGFDPGEGSTGTLTTRGF